MKWINTGEREFDARRFRSVPVGSAIMPKTREASWAGLVPLAREQGKRAVRHKLRRELHGEEVALLAQLRLAPETRSKRIPPTRESSFLLLSHSHILLLRKRMPQVASTEEKGSTERNRIYPAPQRE